MSEDRPNSWDDHLRRDPEAAGELYARYAERLARLAERHLSRRVAGRLDGEDVAQSALRTFFRRSMAGQFKIDSSGQLWSLLARITVMKARAKGRYHTAGKRDAGREADPAGAAVPAWADAEPGPAEVVALADQMAVLLDGLPDESARVLELRLAGNTVTQVAELLGMTRNTVYHVLKELQRKLTEMNAEGES